MQTFIVPVALIAFAFAGWLVVRSRARLVRAGYDVGVLAIVSVILYHAGASPLLSTDDVPGGPQGYWLRAVAIIWWFAASRTAAALSRRALGLDERAREARTAADLLSGAIYVTAVFVVLNFVLKLPVNGVVATSGVIAVVIGLALQNTLADVFSGIAVGIERPFRVGDRVTLSESVEGTVVQVNWRSVRVQTDGEDIATIPNSVVAKAQILNRSFPTERRSAKVTVTVPAVNQSGYILTLLDHAAKLCPDVLSAPPPFAALTRLGVRTSTFEIEFFVSATPMIARTKSLLLQHVHRALRYLDAPGDGAVPPDGLVRSENVAALQLLHDTTLFNSLSIDARTHLASSMTRIFVNEGEALFQEGTEDDKLYMVASGIIEISRTLDDQRTIVGRIGPGDYLGEISLLTGVPHGATATAASTCIVHYLDRAALMPLVAADPDILHTLERSVQRSRSLLERGVAQQDGSQPKGSDTLLHAIKHLFAQRRVDGD